MRILSILPSRTLLSLPLLPIRKLLLEVSGDRIQFQSWAQSNPQRRDFESEPTLREDKWQHIAVTPDVDNDNTHNFYLLSQKLTSIENNLGKVINPALPKLQNRLC